MKKIIAVFISTIILFSCDSDPNITSFKIKKPHQSQNEISQTIFIKINTTENSYSERRYELELFCKSLYLNENKELSWNTSKNWNPKEPIPMSIASFAIDHSTDEITISAFPGEAGGIEANVNRWRKQLNLSPKTINQIKKDTINSPFFGDYYIFHETNSNDNKSIIAAIIRIQNNEN